MKAQVIILTIFLALLSLNSFAKTNEPQETQQKKVIKNKYDFNLFKLYYIDLKQPQTDSLDLFKEQQLDVKRKID